jgi:hypothetical protein
MSSLYFDLKGLSHQMDMPTYIEKCVHGYFSAKINTQHQNHHLRKNIFILIKSQERIALVLEAPKGAWSSLFQVREVGREEEDV